MIIKQNRLELSRSEVVEHFKENVMDKFKMVQNELDPKFLRDTLDEIAKVNVPFKQQILDLVQRGVIKFVTSENPGDSISYLFGIENGQNVRVVYINMAKFVKHKKFVDSNGDLVDGYTFSENYMGLYDLLFGAFCALNTQKLALSSTLMNNVREIWVNLVGQIVSRTFGNPTDGAKFRFLMSVLFYNGDISARDLAGILKYPLDSASLMQEKYPDQLDRSREGLKIEDFLAIAADELPALTVKGEVNLAKFLRAAITGMGVNAVYALDNFPYLFAVLAVQARKSKIKMFTGYLLQNITQKSSVLLSEINKALM